MHFQSIAILVFFLCVSSLFAKFSKPSSKEISEAVELVEDSYKRASLGCEFSKSDLRQALLVLKKAGKSGVQRATAAYALGVGGALLGASLAKTKKRIELSLKLGEIRQRSYEVLAKCHHDAGLYSLELYYLEECARQNQLDTALELALAAAYRRRGQEGDLANAKYYEESACWRSATEEERDPAWARQVRQREAAYRRSITTAFEQRQIAEKKREVLAKARETQRAHQKHKQQQRNLKNYERYKKVKKIINGEVGHPYIDFRFG